MLATGESLCVCILMSLYLFPEREDVPDDAVVSELDEELDGMLHLRVAAARPSPTSPPLKCGAAARNERPKAEYGTMRASEPLLIGAVLGNTNDEASGLDEMPVLEQI